jgi:lipopolysaccharide transport system ATP-binding protein
MKPSIELNGISKQYRLGSHGGGYRTLRESMMNGLAGTWSRLLGRNRKVAESRQTMLALEDITFSVEPGEVVGLIGRNGSGKSTLLKILSRITEPTSGHAVVRGRMASLLEVGTGFHNELTGRENIYLNGSILGMSRPEITRKFHDIVDFAEIGQFLDTPVKRYSSGMYVRLAFAIAAHLDLELLLVDEVLAVGDAAFQTKCLGKMGEVARSGRTVVLVSHSMASIQNLCSTAAVLSRGKLVYHGDCQTGVSRYLALNRDPGGGSCDLRSHPNRRLGMRPSLVGIRTLDYEGQVSQHFGVGDPMRIEVTIEQPREAADYFVQLGLEDHMGTRLLTMASDHVSRTPLTFGGRQTVFCDVDELPLIPGRYSLTVLTGPSYQHPTDAIDQAISFDVAEKDFFGSGKLPHPTEGQFLIRSCWSVANHEPKACS